MTAHPLAALARAGQSVWLDRLNAGWVTNGALARHVARDHVTGVITDPSTLRVAILGDDGYAERLAELKRGGLESGQELYEALIVADVQAACDQLAPVHARTGGRDGFVSLDVSPHLAMDAEAMVREARRLWTAVSRPNLMIKVPGTPEAMPAIRQLAEDGLSVEVTLLFSADSYLQAANAHLEGLCARAEAGKEVADVICVAGVHVSRLGEAADAWIDARSCDADPTEVKRLGRLRGEIALANAKVAYRRFRELLATPRWEALARLGAQPVRLLWASTGLEDAAYPDLRYIEGLIGPDTITTLSPANLEAFCDHGRVAPTLLARPTHTYETLLAAEALGLDLPALCSDLLRDDLARCVEAYDTLLAALGPASRTSSLQGPDATSRGSDAGASPPSP
jgi:transaldolase